MDLLSEENLIEDFDPELHAIIVAIVAALKSNRDEDLVTQTGVVPEIICN